MSEPIKVFLVDDHNLFRRGLAGLINETPDFQVVGEASSGPEAVRRCQQRQPDVVLMDVHMPAGGGLEAVRTLKQKTDVRVLMLTISDKDDDLHGALSAGADGYLLKNAEPEQLCQAIRQVVRGQGVLSPEVTGRVMRLAGTVRNEASTVRLSPREKQVLAELSHGATTPEIADRLTISENTVKTHVRHILAKLEAANRTEAVARAAALGLLSPD
jgi:two-component system nitrate/nitrite response regulator NarL